MLFFAVFVHADGTIGDIRPEISRKIPRVSAHMNLG